MANKTDNRLILLKWFMFYFPLEWNFHSSPVDFNPTGDIIRFSFRNQNFVVRGLIMASYKYVGDRGILVEFSAEISREVNEKVRGLDYTLQKEELQGVEEIIPTYRSLLIFFDPLSTDRKEIMSEVKSRAESIENMTFPDPRIVEIPVKYGGEYGPDLEFVASYNNLKEDEVIDIHTGGEYRVYMLGFTPGFPYLGGMSEKIATPRLDSPREKIARGSVGIAGDQTGIYPLSSPGGWRLIGRTPLDLFSADREEPFLLQVGDILHFVSITEDRYREIRERVNSENFTVKIM